MKQKHLQCTLWFQSTLFFIEPEVLDFFQNTWTIKAQNASTEVLLGWLHSIWNPLQCFTIHSECIGGWAEVTESGVGTPHSSSLFKCLYSTKLCVDFHLYNQVQPPTCLAGEVVGKWYTVYLNVTLKVVMQQHEELTLRLSLLFGQLFLSQTNLFQGCRNNIFHCVLWCKSTWIRKHFIL